jgi:hypothetical protein
MKNLCLFGAALSLNLSASLFLCSAMLSSSWNSSTWTMLGAEVWKKATTVRKM